MNARKFKNSMVLKNLLLLPVIMVFAVLSNESRSQSNAVRSIASVIEDEVLTIPITKSNLDKDVIFREDDSGVMNSMIDEFTYWERKKQFAELWDLEGIEFYDAPSVDDQKKYLGKRFLRYLDRRLSGEMKKAESGSTLHALKIVEQNLRPDTTVKMSENFAVKFKFRVLQGKLIADFRNPWLESNIIVGINGKAKIITKKHLKELGITSGVEYSVTESEMLAYIDHDFSKNIKGRISSLQENGVNIFGQDADARIEVIASFDFNM